MDKLRYLIGKGRVGGVAELIREGVDKVYIVEETCRVGNDVILGYMLRMDVPVDQNMLNICAHYNHYRCCAMILDVMRMKRRNVEGFGDTLTLAIDDGAVDIVHLLCMYGVKVSPQHITSIIELSNRSTGVAILRILLSHVDDVDVNKRVVETSFVERLIYDKRVDCLQVMGQNDVHLTEKQCNRLDKLCSLDIVTK